MSLDGKIEDRFSRMEDAVQAVDYEIGRMGRAASLSALGGAPWRKARDARGAPTAEALRLATWRRVTGRR